MMVFKPAVEDYFFCIPPVSQSLHQIGIPTCLNTYKKKEPWFCETLVFTGILYPDIYIVSFTSFHEIL